MVPDHNHEGDVMTTTGARVEVRNLTKRFGGFTAVDDLSFNVEPGRITGFLGPNGAGKTTSLRMLLGLIKQTSGTATIDGMTYRELTKPPTVVGSALEATNFHPGRSGRNHLRVLAATAGIPDSRVDEMLDLVVDGEPAVLYVGNRLLPRHVTLVLPGERPDVLEVYEPASGTVQVLDEEAFAHRRLRLGGWSVPWILVQPTGHRRVHDAAPAPSAWRVPRLAPEPDLLREAGR